MQLARGIAQPRQDQDLGHHPPDNLPPPNRQSLFQKIDQPHLPAQMQPYLGISKGALPLYRNPFEIDFDPLRFDIAKQSSLSNSSCTCCLLVDAQMSSCIHLFEVCHDALPRISRGAIALDQGLVAMLLAFLLAIAAAQVHAFMLRIASLLSSGLVFTTNGFAAGNATGIESLGCKQEA